MLKSVSNSLILRGALAVIVGIIALAWPGVTILALVILFAIYAFIAASIEAMRAFSSAKAGPVIGHLLLALIDVAAGVIALVWPGPTALVLVLIVAICRAGVGRVRCGALRPSSHWCVRPRAAVRALRPGLRGLADHAGD